METILNNSNTEPTNTQSQKVDDFQISFVGEGVEFLKIIVVNFFLTLFTLGIYTPWAKTNIRKYNVGHIKLNGERFRFTGVGYELFIGWLILIGLGIVLSLASTILSAIFTPLTVIITLMYPLGLGLLLYKSKDYLYKKSEYKGIRFGLTYENLNDYIMWFFIGAISIPFTLGLSIPWMQNKLRTVTLNNLQWGSVKCSYNGQTRDYYIHFIFTILTLGIYYPWYKANLTRYVASKTTFNNDKIRLRSSIVGTDYVGFNLLFFLCYISILGIVLIPLVVVWFKRLYFKNIHIVGEIDLSEVRQEIPITKEGFWNSAIDYLDVMDSDFDIGI